MSGIVKTLKSIYEFFAGDYIMLSGVALAFIAGAILIHFLSNLMGFDVVIFIALIVGGLVLTLSREKRGQKKASR